ncbi:MAG: glycosyltransferase family 2 protein [bacterium]|nr:glycosyltransferase family 2 protein [bacterium]
MNMVNARISCVICAYNEEPRIKNVLEAVANNPLFSEVIVVDDGSKDGTARAVENYKNVRLIKHPVNKGKSEAFVTGISNATGEYIMMLDADLINLDNGALEKLASPVLSGEADISMSLRKNSLFLYRWLGIDYVSGERVFKKNMLNGHLENIKKLPGYGLESYMNDLIIDKKMRLKVVYWQDVRITNKAGKEGFIKGVLGEIRMIRQIVKLMGASKIIRQIYLMRKLSSKT